MITEKENLIRMHRGEMPEYLPNRSFQHFKCSYFVDVKAPGYHKDEFGVEYIGKDDIFGGAPIPYPGRYILDDISNWRDVVKAPDISHVDWERYAKEDLKDIDRSKFGTVFYHGKTFQRLCDFMGFTEGLCAIAEEPDEVYAMFEYITDFNIEVLKNIIYYYKPDSVCIPDDCATARAPFISLDVYRRIVKPFHKRIADLCLDNGVFIEKHDCGLSECFADDWVEMGMCSWNPAQPSNDLVGIKKKFGRKLIIEGGWDSQGKASFPEISDEELKDKLAEYVDTLAPEGGFIYSAHCQGNPSVPVVAHKWDIIKSFYEDYAKDWYKNHR